MSTLFLNDQQSRLRLKSKVTPHGLIRKNRHRTACLYKSICYTSNNHINSVVKFKKEYSMLDYRPLSDKYYLLLLNLTGEKSSFTIQRQLWWKEVKVF